ncbi:LemA family [Mesomycoplasma conjunctivae]|uniref:HYPOTHETICAL Uncharacterized 25.5 kDa protein in gyrB 5region n=1 Tax=Mesomycoplasma conjunctivae (strain ATCC 25834 / NCTC 10147 / HRC/581) TaxID=572263 RepID=C5J5L3_MESCH|nr:LemA family protein [Mesomycoplasma conjunctivae]CAT04736.1 HYPOTHETICAL Uncharacterized 25.5 kDa protein in gyrB 5region [Mesomycoplasma conjunctivae]VEU65745.1 LemA family [Mesomycoplasma conjunctivae]
MANLYDNSEYKDPQGFEPAVDNKIIFAQASTAAKIVFWFFGTLLLFAAPIFYIAKRNSLLRQQVEINQASSTIDTQLAKRADTLIKLVDQVKSYKNFEKDILVDVTKLRSNVFNGGNRTINNSVEIDQLNTSIMSRLIATFENYPELKAIEGYNELMQQSVYLEREVSAARRLYNSKVTQFNSEIITFPTNIVSSTMKISTKPLFQASTTQRQDVSMKDL